VSELDVAVLAVIRLLRRAQRVAGDAAAHVLEPDLGRHEVLPTELGAARYCELLEHLVLHERQDVAQVLVLVVMRVHVDDQHVVEVAAVRLLARIGQQPRGVELFHRYAPAAISNEVHGVAPYNLLSVSGRSSSATCRARTPQGSPSATVRSPLS